MKPWRLIWVGMVIADSCDLAEPRMASALRNQVSATGRDGDGVLLISRVSLRLHGPTNAGEPGASAHTANVSFVVRGEAPLHSGISVGGRHVHQDPVRQPLARASSVEEAARAGTTCAVDPSVLFGPPRGMARDKSEAAAVVISATLVGHRRRRAASMAVRSIAVPRRRGVRSMGAGRSPPAARCGAGPVLFRTAACGSPLGA